MERRLFPRAANPPFMVPRSSICVFLQQLIECDLHEDFEGSVARFSPRTHSAPSQLLSRNPASDSGSVFPGSSSCTTPLDMTVAMVCCQCAKVVLNLLSQLRIRCRDLQTETAHHASGNLSLLAVELHKIHEVPFQTLERRGLRSNQDSGGVFRLARCIPLKCSRGEVFLASKMVVERTFSHIRRFQNLVSPVAL